MNIVYTEARNANWANSDQTAINIEVNFAHLPEQWVWFSAVASGDYPHTHEIYARAVAGDFGPIADYDGD